MARRRQAPPARTSQPPPPLAVIPAAGIIAGTPSAAAGAAGLAAGAKAQATIAEGTVNAIQAMLAAIALRRRRIITQAVAPAFPGTDLSDALAEEDRREIVFRKLSERRVRDSMKLAMKANDPSARTAAIQNVLNREQRYAEMRTAAAGERVLASAELQALRTLSPMGAFWALGYRQRHTPDCIAMAGKFWPWVVLNEVHPLLHVGCGCQLFSYGEAIAAGMMTAADVMTDEKALIMAKAVIQHVREEAAEAQRKYGHLAELEAAAGEELSIRVALVERGADADQLAAAPLSADLMPAPPSVIAEAAPGDDTTTMAMVALYPSPDRARKLAVPRGEKPDQLHVTLAFLGKTEGLDFEKAKGAVESWAKATPPLAGKLSGVGHFDLGKGDTVTYRSVDLPELPAPREKLVQILDKAGTPASTEHGFTPHMSIDYRVRRPAIKQEPIRFPQVTLTWGDERHDFKLGGTV
jgi:2'-5' RNA ligase